MFITFSVDTIEYDVDLDFLKPKVEPASPNVQPQAKAVAHVPTIDRKLKPNSSNNKVSSTDKNSRELNHVVPQSFNIENKNEAVSKHRLNSEALNKPRIMIIPAVPDRKSKPANYSGDTNPISESLPRGRQGDDTQAASELKQLQQLMKKKQEEYELFQKDKERMVAEHKARQSRLESDQKALDDIQNLKDKQLKETADLMRQKRKIEDELRQLENEREAKNSEEKKKCVRC